MFRDRDEAGHVNHEQIASAILVWLAVVASIDVVLNLRTTQLVFGCGLNWRYLINGVIAGVQTR